jgi:hypothetical protein
MGGIACDWSIHMAEVVKEVNIRKALLDAIASLLVGRESCSPEQVLEVVGKKLNAKNNKDLQRLILAEWQQLFTNGLLAWGRDFADRNDPWFHVTDRGKKTIKQSSRDPANPTGYMEQVKSISIGPIAESYVREALNTYNASCFKATAVMIGVAAECLVIDIRDAVAARLALLGRPPNKKLDQWQAKTLLDELEKVVAAALTRAREADRDNAATKKLQEAFTYNWPAMAYMIRSTRNDAGHPGSIDPVTPADVHAALLTFPHHATIAMQMISWVATAPL